MRTVKLQWFEVVMQEMDLTTSSVKGVNVATLGSKPCQYRKNVFNKSNKCKAWNKTNPTHSLN